MKRAGEQFATTEKAEELLFTALPEVRDADEARQVLTDLCTPAELEAIADRWRVARLVKRGLSYREINDRTGVSVTTIGRVARFIEHGAGGYRLLLDRVKEKD